GCWPDGGLVTRLAGICLLIWLCVHFCLALRLAKNCISFDFRVNRFVYFRTISGISSRGTYVGCILSPLVCTSSFRCCFRTESATTFHGQIRRQTGDQRILRPWIVKT